VSAHVVLAQRPCQYLLDRFELDLGQMRRVRSPDPNDLDRAGQPTRARRAGSPDRRRVIILGYRDTPPYDSTNLLQRAGV
jgi:hypothetical protein